MNKLLLGFAGCSGSGKTTVVETIATRIGKQNVTVLDQDSYYKDQSHLAPELRQNVNVDTPEAIDLDMFSSHLENLLTGQSINKPQYDFATRTRWPETIIAPSANVIIAEGLLLFHTRSLRDMFDLKVFVDCPADIRLVRRIRRDVVERNRDLPHILTHYTETVRAFHECFVEPTRVFADLILPGSVDFAASPAVGVIIDGVERFLAGVLQPGPARQFH